MDKTVIKQLLWKEGIYYRQWCIMFLIIAVILAALLVLPSLLLRRLENGWGALIYPGFRFWFYCMYPVILPTLGLGHEKIYNNDIILLKYLPIREGELISVKLISFTFSSAFFLALFISLAAWGVGLSFAETISFIIVIVAMQAVWSIFWLYDITLHRGEKSVVSLGTFRKATNLLVIFGVGAVATDLFFSLFWVWAIYLPLCVILSIPMIRDTVQALQNQPIPSPDL